MGINDAIAFLDRDSTGDVSIDDLNMMLYGPGDETALDFSNPPDWHQFSGKVLERRDDNEPVDHATYLAGVLGVFCLFCDTGLTTGKISKIRAFLSRIEPSGEMGDCASSDEIHSYVQKNVGYVSADVVQVHWTRLQRFEELKTALDSLRRDVERLRQQQTEVLLELDAQNDLYRQKIPLLNDIYTVKTLLRTLLGAEDSAMMRIGFGEDPLTRLHYGRLYDERFQSYWRGVISRMSLAPNVRTTISRHYPSWLNADRISN